MRLLGKEKPVKYQTSPCYCISPSCTHILNTLCSSRSSRGTEESWKRFREYRISKGVTQLLYKDQCRREGLLKLERRWSTQKSMKSLVTQRAWIGIKCWLCLQDDDRPANEADRSHVQRKHKEEACDAAGSESARRSFPKHAGIARSWDALPSIWMGPCHRQTTAVLGNLLSWK